MAGDLLELAAAMRQFANERDWNQYHSPKNLAMALSGEAGELIEHFQWISEQASRELDEPAKLRVSHEMADVLLYLVRLSDVLGIDLLEASKRKLAINADKYPVEKARGSIRKYTEL